MGNSEFYMILKLPICDVGKCVKYKYLASEIILGESELFLHMAQLVAMS